MPVLEYRQTRWILLWAVLGTSVLLGLISQQFLTGTTALVLVGMAIAGCVGVGIYSRPIYGLYALVLGAITIPFTIGTGTSTSLNAAFLLSGALLALWLARMLIRKELHLKPTPATLPALLLMLAFLLGFISGQIRWSETVNIAPPALTVQLAQVALYWFSVGLFLLVANTVTPQQLQRIVQLFLLISFGAIVNFYLYFFGVPLLFITAVGAFPSWSIVFGAAVLFMGQTLPLRWRLLAIVNSLIWLIWGFTTAVELASSWVPAVAAIGMMLLAYSRRLSTFAAILALTIAAARPQVYVELFERGISGGAILRVDLWLKVLDIARLNWVTGVGPALYRSYVLSSITVNQSIFRTLPTYAWDDPSHNQYVDIVTHVGVIGLAAYLAVICAVMWSAWRLYQRGTTPFARGYGLAVLGGATAMLVIGIIGDWVVPYVYNIGITGFRQSLFTWLFFGGVFVFDE